MNLYNMIRFLLFSLDAEKSHKLTLNSLKLCSPFIKPRNPYMNGDLSRYISGLYFDNPIGLAAGFDKNGKYLNVLAKLGFGFITIGTVTPGEGQYGNPKPRVFRDKNNLALWNRMGFPNVGATRLASRLRKGVKVHCPLGISLGKAKDTPIDYAIGDYVDSMRELYPFGDFFEICISSPNTKGLRDLHEEVALESLLGELVEYSEILAQGHRIARKPLWIKLAFDTDMNTLEKSVLICKKMLEKGKDAVIIGNTSVNPGINPDLSKGGYSGLPIFAESLSKMKMVKDILGDSLDVIGNGGLFSGDDVLDMLKGGASLVQIYSSFIYRGWNLISFLKREMRDLEDSSERIKSDLDRWGINA